MRNENLIQKKQYHDPASLPNLDNIQTSSKAKLREAQSHSLHDDENFLHNTHRIVARDSDNSSSSVTNSDNSTDEYVMKIFSLYGDGVTMTIEGFEKLMGHLKLQGVTLRDDHGQSPTFMKARSEMVQTIHRVLIIQ